MERELKPVGPTEAAVRKIAMDVGKQVVEHIEHAYPEMTRAVTSWKSARLSIRNATYNAIMAAVNAADEGRDEEAIAANERHRRTMRKLRKITAEACPENAEETLRKLKAIPTATEGG